MDFIVGNFVLHFKHIFEFKKFKQDAVKMTTFSNLCNPYKNCHLKSCLEFRISFRLKNHLNLRLIKNRIM
jgi:hypothetical protein